VFSVLTPSVKILTNNRTYTSFWTCSLYPEHWSHNLRDLSSSHAAAFTLKPRTQAEAMNWLHITLLGQIKMIIPWYSLLLGKGWQTKCFTSVNHVVALLQKYLKPPLRNLWRVPRAMLSRQPRAEAVHCNTLTSITVQVYSFLVPILWSGCPHLRGLCTKSLFMHRERAEQCMILRSLFCW
jgi:hypothetical protein